MMILFRMSERNSTQQTKNIYQMVNLLWKKSSKLQKDLVMEKTWQQRIPNKVIYGIFIFQ